MQTKPSKTYTKWLNRVKDTKTPWTENEIIYFRKAINSSGLKDAGEREWLITLFYGKAEKNGYNITPEQTQKGINYIFNACFKKNGQLRQSKSNPFGEREAKIIKNFYQFKFVSAYNAGNNYYEFYVPVYRVIAKNGDYFEYTTNMGRMEIVG